MIEALCNLRNPVVLVAFQGWNDASNAATEMIDFLATSYPTELVGRLDSENYYDFQISRPRICLSESGREIEFPSTTLSVTHLPTRDLVLVAGQEPNLRWLGFANELISAFRTIEPDLIVSIGAMLSDAPHTLPTPVGLSTTDEDLGEMFGCEPSTHEGPTGIIGVIHDVTQKAEVSRWISLWAQIPHYIASPPNPKATLALLNKFEEVANVNIDPGELPKLAHDWETKVNSLIADDPDIKDYVAALEAKLEALEASTVTADSIAADFERYLRRHSQSE